MRLPKITPLLILAATPVFAQKERDMIRELQRDVAILQESQRTLNSKFDEKIAIMTTLLQQALEEAKGANRNVAVLDSRLRESLKEQQNMVAAPVAGLGTKVDQMGTDFAALKESVTDLSGRMTKIQGQIGDVLAAIKVLQTPAPPPPSPTQGSGESGGPPAGLNAQALYDMGLKDKQGGNFDLALGHFENYLRWFPDSELAGNVYFHVGEIFLQQDDFDRALTAFETVGEKHPDSNKAPDALYMKGQTLVKAGKRNQAGQVFADVIKLYPTADVAAKAKSARKGLGLPAVPATATSRKRR